MVYYSVNNRCAIDFGDFQLPISNKEAFEILIKKGFQQIEIDILAIAKACVGKSIYRRGSRLSEAPNFFDCSSFIKYLYGQKGIWVPRRSIQQSEFGCSVDLKNITAGDVICVSGHIDYFIKDPLLGVGHVGIVTENNSVIHAKNKEAGIVETPMKNFFSKDNLRTVRRIIPSDHQVYTFLTSEEREVESSDDIGWIIRQNL
jgi:hypothetical protein